MRRANKKDLAHAPIRDGLRERDISAIDMPDPGDLLCYGQHHQSGLWLWFPIEVKSPKEMRQGVKAQLTNSQKKRNLSAAPIPIVETLEEALALYGRTR